MCTWKKGMVLGSPFFTLPVSEDRAQCNPAEGAVKARTRLYSGLPAIVERGRKNRGEKRTQTKYQLQWPKLLAFSQALYMRGKFWVVLKNPAFETVIAHIFNPSTEEAEVDGKDQGSERELPGHDSRV